jgi:hypothetical protein
MHLTLNEPETLEGEQRMHQENLPKERATHRENDDEKWLQSRRSTWKKTAKKPQINTRRADLRKHQI